MRKFPIKRNLLLSLNELKRLAHATLFFNSVTRVCSSEGRGGEMNSTPAAPPTEGREILFRASGGGRRYWSVDQHSRNAAEAKAGRPAFPSRPASTRLSKGSHHPTPFYHRGGCDVLRAPHHTLTLVVRVISHPHPRARCWLPIDDGVKTVV